MSVKSGDCKSLGLLAPAKLPSESEVSKSCNDSIELFFSDFNSPVKEKKIYKKVGQIFIGVYVGTISQCQSELISNI